jgi:hypothetical protein
MKKEFIFAIVAIILVAGILFVTAGTNQQTSGDTNCEDTTCELTGKCPYKGSCTKKNNCENPTCEAEKTGSCGCSR